MISDFSLLKRQSKERTDDYHNIELLNLIHHLCSRSDSHGFRCYFPSLPIAVVDHMALFGW